VLIVKYLPGAWITALKATALASAQVASAIESYHHLLKLRLLNEADESVYWRADWLVDKLGTKVHSYYWLDEFSGKNSFSRYWRSEWSSGPNPWCQGMQIPDSDVVIEGNYASVVSQKNKEKSHVVLNPGSEFALCDCSWSMKGNLCKHVIKSAKVCRDRGLALPSLAMFHYYQALANLVHCPPIDTLISDHAMALAVSVKTQLDAVLCAVNGSSSIRPGFQDPQSTSKTREAEIEEANSENGVCTSQPQPGAGDDEDQAIRTGKRRKLGDASGDTEDGSIYQDSLARKKCKSGEASGDDEEASTEEGSRACESRKPGEASTNNEEVSIGQGSRDHEKRKSGEPPGNEGTSATQATEPSETETSQATNGLVRSLLPSSECT
jgi:hypothetical protein